MKRNLTLSLLSMVALLSMICCNSATCEDDATITLSQAQSYDFTTLQIDEPRTIPEMNGVSPSGDRLDVNTQYMTLNGEPWLPSYGEFQFSRYPAEQWEDVILKMKAAGYSGVSFYIFWIHHEEREGEWEWTGRRDLRKFLELCKKHDILAFPRIGPWCNGDCRNGGHPDWLVYKLGDKTNPLAKNGAGGILRSTDPKYLHYVDKLYEQIAAQMEGLLWSDGGPVFAVQLDNENRRTGPGTGSDLLTAEKELALKHDIRVPFYTSTAWSTADFNQNETLPVYGTYIDCSWVYAETMTRTRAYSFTTVRAEAEVDTDLTTHEEGRKYAAKREHYKDNPYLTCEIGTGMCIAYHRRPLIDADDDAVVSLVELGSGVNAMGYYQAVGGNNPKGKDTFMCNVLGVSNDPSIISNDFQGAIGEFGQVRDKYHVYPAQLNFMTDFGADLAPCKTFIPEIIDQIKGGAFDNSLVLQQAVRTDGERGFIFVNNHIKRDTIYKFSGVQFEIKLKNETLKIPSKPVDIAIGDYFYWGFNLDLNGVKLKSASAQPVCHIDNKGSYLFFQNGDITPEFVLDNENIKSIETNNAKFSKKGGLNTITVTNAGLDCYADVTLDSGKTVRIMVITEEQSRQMYKYNDQLYLSDAESLKFTDETIEVISTNCNNTVWCYSSSPLKDVKSSTDGLFERFAVNFERVEVPFEQTQIHDGKELRFEHNAAKNGKFMVPTDDALYDQGTVIDLKFPNGIPDQLYDLRLNVDYVANTLRLYKDGEFEYDFYYNGAPWELGMRHRLPDYTPDMDLKLKFLPLQPDDRIYIAGIYWANEGHTENVLTINKIEPVPVYSTILQL